MTTLFVDTSALAKRYLNEIGTRWTRRQIRPSAGNVIVVSQLATVEFFAVLARRLRERNITGTTAARLRTVFLRHVNQDYLTVPVDMPVLVQARNLVLAHPLRTLDAIHLAAALRAETIANEAVLFLSADNNLLGAATAEGFATDNPTLHP